MMDELCVLACCISNHAVHRLMAQQEANIMADLLQLKPAGTIRVHLHSSVAAASIARNVRSVSSSEEWHIVEEGRFANSVYVSLVQEVKNVLLCWSPESLQQLAELAMEADGHGDQCQRSGLQDFDAGLHNDPCSLLIC